MKKVMLTLAVVAFAVSLTSCKKTCMCSYSTDGEDLIVVETEIVGGCWDLHTSVTIDGTTRTVTCE